jgi:aspartate/methionine/tyrosine aminotransferase
VTTGRHFHDSISFQNFEFLNFPREIHFIFSFIFAPALHANPPPLLLFAFIMLLHMARRAYHSTIPIRSNLAFVVASVVISARNSLAFHLQLPPRTSLSSRRPAFRPFSCTFHANMANQDATNTHLEYSTRILETLDPCVVLMKTMIADHADEWQDKDGIYSLAQGVVYWEPPDTVNQAILHALKHDHQLHTYCPDEGLVELREALVDKLATENLLTNHNVMITTGANQAFVNVVISLLSQGDQCVVFKPYYFNHVMAVQMTQGNEGLVVGSCNAEGIPDLQWLETTLSQPNNNIQMVTVVNPGNPTGVSLKRDVLQQFVDICGKHGVWLVLDCTYEHFDHLHGSDTFPGFPQEHVIHIFSFSKGHALAGFRCGYLVTSKSNDKLYSQLLKVQDTIPICPARISQVAAMGALGAGRSWVIDKVSTLDVGRRAILEAMAPMECIMGGTGAMYVMGKLPDGINDQEAARMLVKQYGVAVIPGSYCGFPGACLLKETAVLFCLL